MSSRKNIVTSRLSETDKPISNDEGTRTISFGSDAIAEQLSRLDLDYIALVPGSSYRGLHDSLVNFKGNRRPEMLITLHEEHAVSIAHGYAKIAGKPMAAAVHANVGLMHATMAIYNAFTDRVPVVILGATGPVDAGKRRPWIDWIHTAQDQGALIRPFVKWDDQPGGVNAALGSLVHATVAASSKPCAPAYVCLDLSLQEGSVKTEEVVFPDTKRYLSAVERPGPSEDSVKRVSGLILESKKPLFMLGRMAPSTEGWLNRLALVQKFDGRVVTDIKQTAPFPYPHRLQPSAPSVFLSPETTQLIRDADLIVSFDWVDLGGNLKAAVGAQEHPSAKVIHISLDSALHNGWSKDHFSLPPVDIHVHADVDKTLSAILEASPAGAYFSSWPDAPEQATPRPPPSTSTTGDIFMPDLAAALYATLPPQEMCIIRVPLGWSGKEFQLTHPFSFMGMDGGAGIGSGPGQIVGSALALHQNPYPYRETFRSSPPPIPIAILGDGDFLMGSSALWTAARYRLPCLVIVANNSSYFNDEVHQERVAKHRGRPVENKGIGMRLDDPAPNVQKIAEGLGCVVVRKEQVTDKAELGGGLGDAVKEVRERKMPVVVDVRVLPEGYGAAMAEKK